MKENSIILTLPIPPSLNKLFSTITKDRYGRPLDRPKRVKSQDYKNWLQLADIEYKKIWIDYTITWDEWLEAHLNYFLPLYYKNGKKKKQDLDNFLKPTFDFLWDNLKGFKDEYIRKITTEKIDSNTNLVKIILREIWEK